MSHVWSHRAYQGVMSHRYMSYATRINEFNGSWRQIVRGITHSDVRQDEQVLWRHVVRDMTHLYVSWLIYTCDTPCVYMWHGSSMSVIDSFICATWLIDMCDMTHSYVWHDSSTRALRHTSSCMPLSAICVASHSYVWHDVLSFLDGYCSTVQGLLDWFEVDLGFTELLFIQIGLCVMCDITYSDVWHDSFRCVLRLAHMCSAILSYPWHDAFICVTWLNQMCDTTRSCV